MLRFGFLLCLLAKRFQGTHFQIITVNFNIFRYAVAFDMPPKVIVMPALLKVVIRNEKYT